MTGSRERILTFARALYLKGGAEAVTMRSVAQRVGVTATALYRHFDNKDDLLTELIRQGFETFGTYLYRSLSGQTPWDRLELSGRAYLDFALEQREIYRTIFMSPPGGKRAPPGKRDPECDPRPTFQFLKDRIGECIDAGDLRADDPEEVAVALWAQVHGLVSLQISGALGVSDEEFRGLFQRSVERLVAGFATNPPPRRTQ